MVLFYFVFVKELSEDFSHTIKNDLEDSDDCFNDIDHRTEKYTENYYVAKVGACFFLNVFVRF